MDISARLKLIADMQDGVNKAKAEMAALKAHAKKEGKGLSEGLFGELAKENISEIGGALKGALGVGSAVALYETFVGLSEEFSHLNDLAKRFDTNVEGFQRLALISKLSGVSVEGVATAVQKLQRSMEDVGNPKVVEAMRELNLSAVDLAGLSPEEQLGKVATAFNQAQKEGRGFGAVFDLMGKSAGEIIPVLREFEETQKEVAKHKLLSKEDVDILDAFGDQMDLIKNDAKVVGAEIGLWIGKVAAAATALKDVDQSKLSNNRGLMGVDRSALDAAQKIAAENERRKADIEAAQKEEAAKNPAAAFVGPPESSPELDRQVKSQKEKQASQERENDLIRKKAAVDLVTVNTELDRLTTARNAALKEQLSDLEKINASEAEIEVIDQRIAALAGPGLEIEAQRLKLMVEREKKIGDIFKLQEQMAKQEDETATKTAEHREEFLDKAHKAEMDLMPDKDKRAAMIEDMKRQFALSGVASGDMAAMRREIEQKTKSGDLDGASVLEKRYARINEELKSAATLGTGGLAQQVGGAANLTNILTGKGSNQLAERQVDLLKDVYNVLKEIKETNPSVKPVNIENFVLN
jgi:hypothetical protein